MPAHCMSPHHAGEQVLAEQRSLAGLSARVLFPAHAQLAEPDSQHDCSSKAAGLVSVDCEREAGSCAPLQPVDGAALVSGMLELACSPARALTRADGWAACSALGQPAGPRPGSDPGTPGALDSSGSDSLHSSTTDVGTAPECPSACGDLASGVIMLLLASEALLRNPGLASPQREGATDAEACSPSQQSADSQNSSRRRGGRLTGRPSTAPEAWAACADAAGPPSRAQARGEKDSVDSGGTAAKRLRLEALGGCDRCGGAAEEPEGCNHCGQGKVCSQCGTTSTPQWRTGPKGPKTLCNACGTRFLRSRSSSKLR